jgi:hypothetical protein
MEAYGGVERWCASKAIEVCFSAWGWAFWLKWQKPYYRAHARLALWEPAAQITTNGSTVFLEGHNVRIENSSGRVIASRQNARRFFPYGRRALWWDQLDQAYFTSYALWNNLTLPALLLWEDIAWTEVADGKLKAWFPSQLPTHCDEQQFQFDRSTGLLQQHHYTAEVMGEWAKECNVVVEHRDVDGLPYPSRRRVTPRKANSDPRSGPLLVEIEIHDWRLVADTEATLVGVAERTLQAGHVERGIDLHRPKHNTLRSPQPAHHG